MKYNELPKRLRSKIIEYAVANMEDVRFSSTSRAFDKAVACVEVEFQCDLGRLDPPIITLTTIQKKALKKWSNKKQG